jgi:hypothetical protein
LDYRIRKQQQQKFDNLALKYQVKHTEISLRKVGKLSSLQFTNIWHIRFKLHFS